MRSATRGGPPGIGPTGTAIELQRRFRASPDRVFRAWTEPRALREWWCPPGWTAGEIEIDLRPGGSYRIEMSRLCDSTLVAVRGAFLEVTPPRRLVYIWSWDGAFAEMAQTLVTVEIDESEDGAVLTLRHENFGDSGIRNQHRTGWIAACNRLDRVMTPTGELYRHSAD